MAFHIENHQDFTLLTLQDNDLQAFDTSAASDVISSVIAQHQCLIFDIDKLDDMNASLIEFLLTAHQQMYDAALSFAVVCRHPHVKSKLLSADTDNILNVTPTFIEASDIIRMEILEREIMNGDDIDF